MPLDEWEPGFNFYKYAIEIEEININGAWIDTCNLYVKRGLSYLSLEEAITVDLYDLLEKENEAA